MCKDKYLTMYKAYDSVTEAITLLDCEHFKMSDELLGVIKKLLEVREYLSHEIVLHQV